MREEFVNFSIPEEQLPFFIVLSGTSWCDGSYSIQRENASILNVEYVIAGEGTVILEGKQYRAGEGDIYLLPPGRDHHYYSDAHNPWIKIWFTAMGPLINQLLDIYNPRQLHLFPAAGGSEYFEQIHAIGRDSTLSGTEKHDRAALVFHQLMQYLYRRFYQSEQKISDETIRMKDYIQSHIARPITLRELGDAVFLSESQIIRIFKKDLGVTPYDYILDLKLLRAKTLLQNTALRVRDVAFSLGFHDEHYFSYLFRQKTGKTPTAYRKGL